MRSAGFPTGPLLGGHEERLQGLWRAARDARLPHALLFAGPAGIGKFAAALRLAQGLLCARAGDCLGPCGSCPACVRAASGNHLDLFVLDVTDAERSGAPREERIKLDRIVRREGSAYDGPVIEEFLSLRAADSGWRVVVVREAERLAHSQNEAQNAMLKMLEEPGQQVLWVLESSEPEGLLPTIRSRCVRVEWPRLSIEDTMQVLERALVTGERAERLARWSRGSPGTALALGERGAIEFRTLIEDVLAGRRSALGAARGVWEVEGKFEGKTPSAREREQARVFLDLCLEVGLDRARLTAGAPPEDLAHGDLDPATAGGGPERSAASLEALLSARADIERNLAPQAVVDAGLLALAPTPGGRPQA